MTGSWFLIREESLEKAKERLSKDVYVIGGAWDLSKVRSLARRRSCETLNSFCNRPLSPPLLLPSTRLWNQSSLYAAAIAAVMLLSVEK